MVENCFLLPEKSGSAELVAQYFPVENSMGVPTHSLCLLIQMLSHGADRACYHLINGWVMLLTKVLVVL